MRVHDSQAYRKMGVTREHISHILKLREILLSFQTGFNLVNAADVCAILESISSLEPLSLIPEPRYLKLVSASSFCPFYFDLCVDATGVVCHQLGLLGTDPNAVGCGGLLGVGKCQSLLASAELHIDSFRFLLFYWCGWGRRPEEIAAAPN